MYRECIGDINIVHSKSEIKVTTRCLKPEMNSTGIKQVNIIVN